MLTLIFVICYIMMFNIARVFSWKENIKFTPLAPLIEMCLAVIRWWAHDLSFLDKTRNLAITMYISGYSSFFSQAIMSSVEEMMIYRIRRKTCWQYIRFQFSSHYVLIYALNDNMPPCAIYTRNMFFFCIIIHYKIIVCLPLVEFQSWKDIKFPCEGS